MALYRRRDKFSSLSEGIGNFFRRFGLSPNQWTFISLFVVLFSFYFLIMEDFLIAAGLFIVSAFIDMIDGAVARATGKASKLGAYLDTIIDRYVEGIVVFGLLFVSLPDFMLPARIWLFAYLFGAMMTTYSKAAAKEKGLASEELKGGLLERAERLIILFIGILLAHFDRSYLVFVLAALAILTNLSALQRIWIAVRKA